MKKFDYKPMRAYKLFRSTELDHKKGRPVIFLDFLGDQSLVWAGTTIKSKNKEKPFSMLINNATTYFYNKNLIKVNTNALISKWKNQKTRKILVLNDDQQKLLISKFSTLTFQIDPYIEIKMLRLQNNLLEKELKQMKNQKISKEFNHEMEE
ncbi:MAG: hypothetical protein REH79_02335 [Spiroplasma sp.]|nr:hypothetical protein [Spiroplasma sp.]